MVKDYYTITLNVVVSHMHIMSMQMRTAIIEKQIFFNIWKTVHDSNHENGVYTSVSMVED